MSLEHECGTTADGLSPRGAGLSIRVPPGRVAGLRRRAVYLAIAAVAATVAAALIAGLGIGPRTPLVADSDRPVDVGTAPARPDLLSALPDSYADAVAPNPPVSLAPTSRPAATGDACANCATDTPATAPPRADDSAMRDELARLMDATQRVGDENKRLVNQLDAYEDEAAKQQSKTWASGLFFKLDVRAGGTSVPAGSGAVRNGEAPGSSTSSDLTDQRRTTTESDRKLAFLAEAAPPGIELDRPYLRTASPYQLQAGTVIPAALLTSINTDLPGDVLAVVTAPVYDSRTGRYLLVPQGARLYGSYDGHVTPGQDRALLVWHRLLMPNGRSVELDHMRGTDAAGRAGVADAVDYHADKLALGAALSGVIAYAGNLARSGQDSRTTAGDVIGDTVAEQAGRVGSRIVDRQLDVPPTVTVRPGWPVRVLVNRDVTLEPYSD